jgi:hypothetical protein
MVKNLKNLVLKKMDSLVDNQSLIEQITSLSSLDQIIETILVDDKTGTIEIFKTIKDVDSVRNITDNIEYKLKSTRLIIKSDENYNKNIIISDIDSETIRNNKSLYDCIARNTNNIFAKEFSKLKNTINHQINYFNQGFFKKLLNKTTKEDFLNKTKELSQGYSWLIIPKNLIELFTIDGREPDSLIYNLGRFEDLNVYVNPDQIDSKIYFGNYSSLTLIINKNLETKEIKTNSTTYTKGISMEVNYLVIENSPITVLEVQ